VRAKLRAKLLAGQLGVGLAIATGLWWFTPSIDTSTAADPATASEIYSRLTDGGLVGKKMRSDIERHPDGYAALLLRYFRSEAARGASISTEPRIALPRVLVDRLERHLNDPDWGVRYKIATAILFCDPSRSGETKRRQESIRACVVDPNERVRDVGVSLVASCRGPVPAWLAELSRSPERFVRLAATRALVRLAGRPEAPALLAKLAEDADADVRNKALYGLTLVPQRPVNNFP
jgi:HEAT repeat protein